MTITCHGCGAETSNGLALCDLCRRKVTVDLEFIPIYFRNLARWKPGRAGSRPVPGSRPPSGVGTMATDRVSNMLDEAGAELVGWALQLEDYRGVDIEQVDDEGTMVIRLCELLTEHLTSIATTDWAGDFVVQVGRMESDLRRLTEQVAPGWYAGGCKRCDSGTYVVPGLTWVTCGGCGATTYARDHLETILKEARGWVAPPMRLAESVVALMDTELSIPRLHKRISKWGEREQIDVVRDSDYERKRYRLGDVLDRLRVEGQTRLEDPGTTSRVGVA